MPKGIVVSFNRNSGFGFIETEGVEKPVFVHHSAISDPDRQHLVAGQQVEFSLTDTDRGLRAEAVNVLRDVPAKAQRKLDWRHRRGSQPVSGAKPRPYRPIKKEIEEGDGEEGVLHAPHVADRTAQPTKPVAGE